MDILEILQQLSKIRPVFYSEADFQFALAWEIQTMNPAAELRLEVPCGTSVNGHIDMIIRTNLGLYPIELKYLKKKLEIKHNGEIFRLPDGVHDVDMYNCIKDLARLETFRNEMEGYQKGYAIWLSNDPAFWSSEYPASYYSAFHAPHHAIKSGTMKFEAGSKILNQMGYSNPITLNGSYTIHWHPYSNFNIKNGEFKFTMIGI